MYILCSQSPSRNTCLCIKPAAPSAYPGLAHLRSLEDQMLLASPPHHTDEGFLLPTEVDHLPKVTELVRGRESEAGGSRPELPVATSPVVQGEFPTWCWQQASNSQSLSTGTAWPSVYFGSNKTLSPMAHFWHLHLSPASWKTGLSAQGSEGQEGVPAVETQVLIAEINP